MPSTSCRCGEILRYGDIPCPIEWLFVSNVAYDKFAANIDAEELYKAMHSFFEVSTMRSVEVLLGGLC